MKRIIPMLAALICSVTAGLAQTRTINGKVTDPADSTPVIGAVVIIKGDTGTTLTGTTTDADGKYSADITAAAKTVEIQCLGYKTASVAINGRTTINVSLEQESQMIEETVVTALGINRAAKSLNYARQKVDTEMLTEARSGDLVSSLSGKIAGVSITPSGVSNGTSSWQRCRAEESLTLAAAAKYACRHVRLAVARGNKTGAGKWEKRA